jgi:hypothetical protein
LLLQLALEVLVPVQIDLGVVRKVGAELQEEGAEVAIHTVEVVMIHQGRQPHIKVGKYIRFRREDILGWLDTCQYNSRRREKLAGWKRRRNAKTFPGRQDQEARQAFS